MAQPRRQHGQLLIELQLLMLQPTISTARATPATKATLTAGPTATAAAGTTPATHAAGIFFRARHKREMRWSLDHDGQGL